jgi:outer membrane autotransporter protein
MKVFKSNNFVCRVAAPMALLIVSLAATERAEAICLPDPLVNGVTAACTSTTTNQSGSNGYGTGAETGVNITVVPGASVTGTTSGIAISGGTVTNAGTITGGTNSVLFTGIGTNTLILQTGAVLNGDAAGALGADSGLILQGSGIANNDFQHFNTLDVRSSGAWVWNTISSFGIDATTISSGTFVVNGSFNGSTITVKAGGTLAGHGTLEGDISVANRGVLAPGAAIPFSTLHLDALGFGSVNFQDGSIFRVNVNAAGQSDKLQINRVFTAGTATLTGGTVDVRAQSGTYAPSTQYNILTATGGLGGTTFKSVTSSLPFLTPSLTYDTNNVFLTLVPSAVAGTGGFSSVAQTRNQRAVAGALDASPANNPLVIALLTQTDAAGARQALDALSGEVFGSVHNTQGQEAQFAREAMLGRMRQASYANTPGELGPFGALSFGGPQLAYASVADANAANAALAAFPVKAAPGPHGTSRDLTFWAQGLGGWGRADSDGNAASLRSRFGGFLSGVDARLGDTLRAGFVAGYMRSDLNVDARASSAGIDSVQLGAYAGTRIGAFNVRGGASWSLDSIDTSRAIVFPGFTDQAKARFHGNVAQVFGEIGYGMAFGRIAVEPLAGLAYVHVHDNSFLESGGLAALIGSRASEDTEYSSLGVRAATAVPLANGTVLVPRGSLQWQHAFGDVTPTSALAFQGTGAAFTVAGIPIARDAAPVEGGFDWRFNPHAKLGAFYQGELAAHAQAHAFKGAFTWNF